MARLGRGRPNQWRPRYKVQVDVLNPVFDDTLGATDTADRSLAAARLSEDTATLSDSVTYIHGKALSGSAADTATGADTTALHRGIRIPQTSTLNFSSGFGTAPFGTSPFGSGTTPAAGTWVGSDVWTGSAAWGEHGSASPASLETVGITDSVSILLSQGSNHADTAALTDTRAVVQTQFKASADTLGATDAVSTGLGTNATDYADLKDELFVQYDVPGTTGSLVATGTPTTTGATWANLANATGAANATVATFTTGTVGAVGTIRLPGYDAQTAIGNQPSRIDNIDVTVTYRVATAARWAVPTVQLFAGDIPIGSPTTLPGTNPTVLTARTVTFTGANLPTWEQLVDLRVQVSINRISSTTSEAFSLDSATAVIRYTNSASPEQFQNWNPPIDPELVALTDSTEQVQTQFKASADSLAITDPATTTAVNFRSADDTATGSDSVVALRGLPDPVPADTAALSDSVSFVQGQTASRADTATGADSAARVLDAQRQPADTVAATDLVTWVKFVNAGNDQSNLTDTPSTALAARRAPADTAGISDYVEISGTSSRPVKSTANIVAQSGIGMRRTARLKSRSTARVTATADLKRGPQRMPVKLALTGELTRVRPVHAETDVVTRFDDPDIRIVRAMTTAIRMTDEELAMQLLEERMAVRLTNVAEPEPEFDPYDDPDYLPEPVMASGPRRYGRSFETLRL